MRPRSGAEPCYQLSSSCARGINQSKIKPALGCTTAVLPKSNEWDCMPFGTVSAHGQVHAQGQLPLSSCSSSCRSSFRRLGASCRPSQPGQQIFRLRWACLPRQHASSCYDRSFGSVLGMPAGWREIAVDASVCSSAGLYHGAQLPLTFAGGEPIYSCKCAVHQLHSNCRCPEYDPGRLLSLAGWHGHGFQLCLAMTGSQISIFQNHSACRHSPSQHPACPDSAHGRLSHPKDWLLHSLSQGPTTGAQGDLTQLSAQVQHHSKSLSQQAQPSPPPCLPRLCNSSIKLCGEPSSLGCTGAGAAEHPPEVRPPDPPNPRNPRNPREQRGGRGEVVQPAGLAAAGPAGSCPEGAALPALAAPQPGGPCPQGDPSQGLAAALTFTLWLAHLAIIPCS